MAGNGDEEADPDQLFPTLEGEVLRLCRGDEVSVSYDRQSLRGQTSYPLHPRRGRGNEREKERKRKKEEQGERGRQGMSRGMFPSSLLWF